MRRPEDNLQMHIVSHIRKVLPHALVFSIPNGGRRSVVEGRMMKATGLLAGMPDIGITIENGITYFIEVKAHGGTLNPNQKKRRAEMESLNIPCATVRSLQETVEILAEWNLTDG